MLDLSLPAELKALVSHDAKVKYYSRNPLKPILIKGFFNKLIEMTRAANPRQIIEIGCGDGLAGYLIRKNIPGVEYFGADLQSRSLATAAQILTRDLVMLDARCLPFPDKSFDLALSLEVFEHVAEWETALREGIRVSRKALIFSVPAYPWYQLSNLVFLKNVKRMGEHPEHLVQFPVSKTRDMIVELCKPLKLKAEFAMGFPWLIVKMTF